MLTGIEYEGFWHFVSGVISAVDAGHAYPASGYETIRREYERLVTDAAEREPRYVVKVYGGHWRIIDTTTSEMVGRPWTVERHAEEYAAQLNESDHEPIASRKAQ